MLFSKGGETVVGNGKLNGPDGMPSISAEEANEVAEAVVALIARARIGREDAKARHQLHVLPEPSVPGSQSRLRQPE
jgi:hypothetical protein